MNLFIIYFSFCLLLIIESTPSSTSRRLLFFRGIQFPFTEKKSSRHSSIKQTPSKVYIQPQTSQELGRKIRSYTHLLKPKLFTNEEKLQLKRRKKKQTVDNRKIHQLVPINQEEINRCRTVLQIDSKRNLSNKKSSSKKNKNGTNTKKKTANVSKNSSIKEKKKPIKTTSSSDSKSTKPETITIIERITTPFDETEDENNSVVNRAFYFVKNMFQLASENQILDLANEQQISPHHHHHSRKLLSFNENIPFVFAPADDFSSILSKRQLLATKNKSSKKKKAKQTNLIDTKKPKVGWTYRYRISRYLHAQKTKSKASMNRKVSKRKLHQHKDHSKSNRNDISDQNIIDTVTITTNFVPKRQLLASKTSTKKKTARSKSVDPIAIVHTHDQDASKPHVGWQFRYRISRYMDSLRENIHKDQERLKSSLQAMKHQRDVESHPEEKPNVGWQYRYRVNKMNEAKAHGADIVQEVKKKSSIETNVNKKLTRGDENLDPELAQISEEGRKVGWTYRYRIRRKLDHLKQIQTETGVPYDLATLSGKREKKANKTKTKPIEKKKDESIEEKTKSVGWEYRYRVSKMHEAQKQKLTPKERTASPRKLDSSKASPSTKQKGKRTKKTIKKSPVTPNPIASSIFSDLLSAAKESLCSVPISSSFCDTKNQNSIPPKKRRRIKKLRTKKEHRAKQFIRGHSTKLGAEDKATERRVDEQMKKLYKRPSYPPVQTPPRPPTADLTKTHGHIEKKIGVDSKKNKNKKQYQIIGQEIKIKPKHSSSTTTVSTTKELPTTTIMPPLRTLSELIRDEAATILATNRKGSQTPEEIRYEINETEEIIREQKKLQATTTDDRKTSAQEHQPSPPTQQKKHDEENVINLTQYSNSY